MNAQEQIAALRRACQMLVDFETVPVPEWDAKYPDAVRDSEYIVGKTVRDALAASATPPDDDVATLRKERDEALAKLAAAQKEIADIYAAKPTDPQFKAEGLRVYQQSTLWSEVASCRTEGTAKDIADALNSAGGGK